MSKTRFAILRRRARKPFSSIPRLLRCGADVVLTPHGLGPVIVADDDPDAPVIREPADLKEIGADREPW